MKICSVEYSDAAIVESAHTAPGFVLIDLACANGRRDFLYCDRLVFLALNVRKPAFAFGLGFGDRHPPSHLSPLRRQEASGKANRDDDNPYGDERIHHIPQLLNAAWPVTAHIISVIDVPRMNTRTFMALPSWLILDARNATKEQVIATDDWTSDDAGDSQNDADLDREQKQDDDKPCAGVAHLGRHGSKRMQTHDLAGRFPERAVCL